MAKSSRFSEQDTIIDGYVPEPTSPTVTAPSPALPQGRSSVETSGVSRSSVMSDRDIRPFADRISTEKISHFHEEDLPEAISPPIRLRAVREHENEKEAYNDTPIAVQPALRDQPSRRTDDSYKESIPNEQIPKPRRKICGIPILFFILICIAVVIIVIVAIVLGVVLGKNKKSKNSSNVVTGDATIAGGGRNPSYFSQEGAFNGSGIAVTSVNFGIDPSIFVFYQKYTGEIEQMINRANGDWAFVTTVATNARNATPLSAVAYIVDSVATWHLFYIDTNNQIRQRTSTNSSNFQTNIWTDGPINNLNLKAYGSQNELVGMQACYWGNYYGSDSDFNKGFNASKTQPTTGMNLWYANNADTFEQYVWTNGETTWTHAQSWTGYNTHGGVACQSWETGATIYLMLIDSSNNLQVFWKDSDLNKTSTTQHPIDTWTKTAVTVPDLHPASSLGYTDWLAYQASDTTLHGINITFAAENTTISAAPNSTDSDAAGLEAWGMMQSDAGLPGTHFAITGLNQASGGRTLSLLYQQNGMGDGIRLGRRDSFEGDWSFNEVPLGGSA